MTTKEMIEVMEAYERGEEIQCIRSDYCDKDDYWWKDLKEPTWAFDECDYRIKPKRLRRGPKFKVGDKIINKSYCDGGTLSTDDIHTVVELKDDYYITLCDAKLNFKFADENCVNISDCLWFWEVQERESDKWFITYTRCNFTSISEKYEAFFYTYHTPIYSLGARLPKSK